jgi:hypothetical protein
MPAGSTVEHSRSLARSDAWQTCGRTIPDLHILLWNRDLPDLKGFGDFLLASDCTRSKLKNSSHSVDIPENPILHTTRFLRTSVRVASMQIKCWTSRAFSCFKSECIPIQAWQAREKVDGWLP